MNPEIPSVPFSRSSVAKTKIQSAMGALVMNIFVPFRTYLLPFLTACVRRLKASVTEAFHSDDYSQWIRVRTAVLGGNGETLDAEFRALLEGCGIEVALAVPLDHIVGEFGFCELNYRLAKCQLLWIEGEVHG